MLSNVKLSFIPIPSLAYFDIKGENISKTEYVLAADKPSINNSPASKLLFGNIAAI